MELCKSANHRHNTLHQQLQLLNPPNFTLHLLLPSIHNHNCPCTIIPYLPLLVHIAAINCLEHQVLCNICVDKHSHKSAVRHHELQPKTKIHQHSHIAHTCPHNYWILFTMHNHISRGTTQLLKQISTSFIQPYYALLWPHLYTISQFQITTPSAPLIFNTN